MSRENFHRLLQRYLNGQCTPEEAELVHHWYRLLGDRADGDLTAGNLDELEDVIWNRIQQQIQERQSPERIDIRRWLVAASIIALLVTVGTLVYLRIVCYPAQPSFATVTGTRHQPVIETVRNATNEPMRIVLPDESLVELSPGATLEYPRIFEDHKREVRLTGDAFFTVAANPDNPFWVFHEGMITKVVGTKFKIKAPRGDIGGEVIVYSGKVDVYSNLGRTNLIRRIWATPDMASLTTNKKAVLLPDRLVEGVTDNPLPLAGRGEAVRQVTFHDVPMPALAETLSNVYGLDVIADDDLASITFTGDISGIGLFKQLDMISMVTNTRYEVVGSTICLKRK